MRHRRSGPRLRERLQRRQARVAQPRDLRPTRSRDKDKAVFGAPPILTDAVKLAQCAVFDRIRFARARRSNCRFEARAHAPVVGSEIVVAQRALLADAKEYVDVLGPRPLNRRDAVAVEAELQNVGRLLGAGELRIERLVAPRAEFRFLICSNPEVGTPSPLTVD